MPRVPCRFVLFSLISALGGLSAQAQPVPAGALPPLHPSLHNVPLGLVPEAGVRGGAVLDLIQFDDGSGPTLYAAGDFWTVGERKARSLARRVDGHWWPLPDPSTGSRPWYSDIEAFNGALYVAGTFNVPDGSAAGTFLTSVQRWNGQGFDSLSLPPLNRRPALQTVGSNLAIIGLRRGDGVEDSGLALWNGRSLQWAPVDAFVPGGIATVHQGSLFAAGTQEYQARVARWTGATWSVLPGVFNYWPEALHGEGGSLYLGGSRTLSLQGQVANGLFRWQGSSWTPVPGGRALDVNALGSVDGSLYVSRSNSGSCSGAANNCATAVDVWQGEQLQPPRFDRAGAATMIGRVGGELVFGGFFDEFHEDDAGARGIPTMHVSETSGVRSFMAGASPWASAYLDAAEGPIAGGFFSLVGNQVVNCVAQFREGRWQPLGAGLPKCEGPNEWEATALVQTSEGLFAMVHNPWGASHLYRFNGSFWSEVALPETQVPYVPIYGSGGRMFALGRFDVYERIAGAWQVAFAFDGGYIQDLQLHAGDIYVRGRVPQFAGDSRTGLWVRRAGAWEFLAGHPGSISSFTLLNGQVYAAATLTGGQSAILRHQAGTWQTLYTSSSPTASVGVADGQLISQTDRGITIDTPQGTRRLQSCEYAVVGKTVTSHGLLLIPGLGSQASQMSCVFAQADQTTLSVTHMPSRPVPGEPLRFDVEVSAAAAPSGGVIEIMGLPAGGCVVRNLAPVSATVARGSCELSYTRAMDVVFTPVYRGFVDAQLRAWTPATAPSIPLQVTAALFSDSFEAQP
jgi:hypothetical protein